LYFINELGVTKLSQKNLTAKELTQSIFHLRELGRKSKIFRNSTSNSVRALSYLAGRALTNETPKIPRTVTKKIPKDVVVQQKNRSANDKYQK